MHAGGERVHVAVVTFDSSVHFYSLRGEQSAFQMLVVPDAQQPYCPTAASSLIVPLHESRALVCSPGALPFQTLSEESGMKTLLTVLSRNVGRQCRVYFPCGRSP